MVLFILAVVWAVYLASWLRSRRHHRGVNSISSFNHHLTVLERTSPARYGIAAVPHRVRPGPGSGSVASVPRGGMCLADARRRRRDVLYALVGTAFVTLALAVIVGGGFVWLHLLVDALLVAYVALLVRAQRLVQERRAKVRYLAPLIGDAAAAPAYLVQSSAR